MNLVCAVSDSYATILNESLASGIIANAFCNGDTLVLAFNSELDVLMSFSDCDFKKTQLSQYR